MRPARLGQALALALAIAAAASAAPAGPAAAGEARPAVCLPPRDPASGVPLVRRDQAAIWQSAVSVGLYELCLAYRAGRLAPDEYRRAMQAVPDLVILVVAAADLQRLRLATSSSDDLRAVIRALEANAAFRALCSAAGPARGLAGVPAACPGAADGLAEEDSP